MYLYEALKCTGSGLQNMENTVGFRYTICNPVFVERNL